MLLLQIELGLLLKLHYALLLLLMDLKCIASHILLLLSGVPRRDLCCVHVVTLHFLLWDLTLKVLLKLRWLRLMFVVILVFPCLIVLHVVRIIIISSSKELLWLQLVLWFTWRVRACRHILVTERLESTWSLGTRIVWVIMRRWLLAICILGHGSTRLLMAFNKEVVLIVYNLDSIPSSVKCGHVTNIGNLLLVIDHRCRSKSLQWVLFTASWNS